MLTLCFTTLAAADLRRSQNSRKNSPRATVARVGLIAFVVVALAGTANAGGHGGGLSLGGLSSGGGNKSSFIQRAQSSLSNSNSAPKFDLKKSTVLNNIQSAPRTTQLDKKINLGDMLKNNGNTGIAGGLNKKIDLGNLKNSLPSNKNLVNVLKKDNLGPHLDVSKKLSQIFSNKNGDHCQPGKIWDKCNMGCHKSCSWWNCWNYRPNYCSLYRYSCGCYQDVPVVVIQEGVDLQMLAVRILDAGDANGSMGPAYRVWVRNNSNVAIARGFNVVLVAARDTNATSDLPQAGVRIEMIQPGEVLPVDIRLPANANMPGLPMLHVVVDSNSELNEVYEDNNGIVIARSEVLPVETQASQVAPAIDPNFAPNNMAPNYSQNVAPVNYAPANGPMNGAPAGFNQNPAVADAMSALMGN
jgi:hypothetical protein